MPNARNLQISHAGCSNPWADFAIICHIARIPGIQREMNENGGEFIELMIDSFSCLPAIVNNPLPKQGFQ
jgi:hypothetical protein